MADITKITPNTLINAERVEGTSVYNAQGDKLGSIDDIMLDKVSGKAIYAIMSFGGFLGIGEKYHPIPWSALNYDESKGGYVVNLDKQMLERAPTYDMDEDFLWTPDYGRQVDRYLQRADLLVGAGLIGFHSRTESGGAGRADGLAGRAARSGAAASPLAAMFRPVRRRSHVLARSAGCRRRDPRSGPASRNEGVG
ncbi:MAG: PRC-barrel domain-containing protein [Rhodospirillales bacterium]|nr:PRC-barrel domain-containing protein [Rhodospirillales bacterium]